MSFPQCGYDTDYYGIPGDTYCTLKHESVEDSVCAKCPFCKSELILSLGLDND